MAMTKSALAAAANRFSISSQGVSKSLKLMEAKSCISGAPSKAEAALKAATPGMTSNGIFRATLRLREFPNQSGHGINTSVATAHHDGFRPERAHSTADFTRSTSPIMPVETTSLPSSSSGGVSSMYPLYPATTSASSRAFLAAGVSRLSSPGPKLTALITFGPRNSQRYGAGLFLGHDQFTAVRRQQSRSLGYGRNIHMR